MDFEQRFSKASALFRARDAAGAAALLQQIIDAQPDHAAALHLLGLIVGRAGDDAHCIALLARAIAHGSAEQQVASGLLLGAAHRRARRLEAAEISYRAVLAIAPGSAEASLRLGLLLQDMGRSDEAVGPLSDAIGAEPNLAVAHAALAAACHAIGDLAAAAASAAMALSLEPANRDFAANLAVVHTAQGRFSEAVALCRRALVQGPEPALLNTLGIALQHDAQLDKAVASFEQALVLRPDFVAAQYNLAAAYKDQGRTDAAVAALRKLVDRAPDLAAARIALCMAHLPPLYRDESEIETRRAAYAAELEALIVHADRVGAAILAPGIGAAQPFYLAYQGRADRALQARYGELVCRAMADAYAPVAMADPPAPGERIRVGFVCGHIRDHSVWRLPTRGWVEAIDRSRFELFAYHTSAMCDAETERAKSRFDRFVQGPLTVTAWRDRIAGDRLHALIYPEIGMDPMAAQLAAMRFAPVQYTSWGHPVTSGYPTMDFFLSSADMEPELGDSHYTEHLVRLPGLSTPVPLSPAVQQVPSRVAFGLPEDRTLYWCGQSLYKYLPQHDVVFAEIASKVPRCSFIFIEFPGSPALTQRFRDRLAAAFSRKALVAEEYCIFLPRMAGEPFRAAMAGADIVLDSIGWSGCNSLIDALAHALPIVTLPGEMMRSRHGAAILRGLGEDQSICADLAGYIALAVSLAGDPDRRARISAACRTNLGRFQRFDAVRTLEQHLADSCRSIA